MTGKENNNNCAEDNLRENESVYFSKKEDQLSRMNKTGGSFDVFSQANEQKIYQDFEQDPGTNKLE